MEGYDKYKEIEVETSSGVKLIVMLYNGAIKFLTIAIDAIKERKLDVANRNIIKAQDIITELMTSLNFEAGDIAKNLYNLYNYMNRRLLEANIEKNIIIINEVIVLLNNLKSGWEELLNNQNKNVKNTTSNKINISG